MFIKKHKCCCCNKMAVWKTKNKKYRSFYYCEDCVPRGSYWNVNNISDFGEPTDGTKVMWWDSSAKASDMEYDGTLERGSKSFYYEYLDEKGRRNPNYNDFSFNAEGYPISNNQQYGITWQSIYESLHSLKDNENLSLYSEIKLKDLTEHIFLTLRTEDKPTVVNYNKFMNKLGLDVAESLEIGLFTKEEKMIKNRYNQLKYEISKRKYKI